MVDEKREKALKTLEDKENSLKTVIGKKLESAETLRAKALNTKVNKAKKVDEKREKALKTLENKEITLKTAIDTKLVSAETLRN